MTGQIVAGRQEPEPGSQRARSMARLRDWCERHPAGASYAVIAADLRMPVQRVCNAAGDLQRFSGSDFVVSIPAPRNGYRFRAGWNDTAKQGEANQARHLATRLESQQIRLDKAVTHETDPATIALMQMRARLSGAEADNQRTFAETVTLNGRTP